MNCQETLEDIRNLLRNPITITKPQDLYEKVHIFNSNCNEQEKQELYAFVIEHTTKVRAKIISLTRGIKLDPNVKSDDITSYKKYVEFYKLIMSVFYPILKTQFNADEFNNNLRLFGIKLSFMNKKANISGTISLLQNDLVRHYLQTKQIVDIKVLKKKLEELEKSSRDPTISLLDYAKYFRIVNTRLSLKLKTDCPTYNLRNITAIEEEKMMDDHCILLHLFNSEIEKIVNSLRSIDYKKNKISSQKSRPLLKLADFFKKINNLEIDNLDNFYHEWMNLSDTIDIPKQASYDVFSYLSNGMDNFIDLFVSLVSESNRDLLMFGIHSSNINAFYSNFEQIILDQEKEQERAKSDIRLISTARGVPQMTTPQYVYNTPSRGGGKKGKLPKHKTQRGGEPGNFCLGNMDESTTSNEEKLAYYTLGISKTRDELKHDFNFKKDTMTNLLKIYDSTINAFVTNLTQYSANPEISKIIQFINLLQSYSVGSDSEWNYYTSVLQTMDAQCNKLEELTMTKVATLDKYPYLDTQFARENGYIVNFEGKKYLYMAIDNNHVVPLFDFKDVCTSVKDNATADFKLYPLIVETVQNETTKEKDVNPNNLQNFTKSLFDFYYAPGMIDPKTIGTYPETNFTANQNIESIVAFPAGFNNLEEYKTALRAIQLSQDINKEQGRNSRIDMMNGINSFMRYFGANYGTQTGPIVDPDTIRFIVNGNSYIGIQFSIPTSPPTEIQLQIGDTTIDNVTNFVNKFDGVIPLTLPADIDLLSWRRLHTFGITILNLIPKNILDVILGNIGTSFRISDRNTLASYLLTEIIITLKSFGDSFQVYYSKKLRDRIKATYGLDLYLSSTDKNVGGECLLLNNTFWLIGTGIRPHSDLFAKSLGFFGKESFKNRAAGLNIIQGETDIDGTIAITTNKSLMDESKYIESINSTFLKIYPNLQNAPLDPAQVPEVENEFYGDGSILSSISSVRLLLSDQNVILTSIGKDKLNSMLSQIRSEDPNIKNNLKELDAFLKKIYDVVKLTEVIPTAVPVSSISVEGVPVAEGVASAVAEGVASAVPIPETKKTLLFKKLETLTAFMNMKFCLSLRAISKSKIVKDQGKLQEVITTAMTTAKIDNIFTEDLFKFSQNFLNQVYIDSFGQAHTEYDRIMEVAKVEIANTLLVLNSEDEVQTQRRPPRQAVLNSKEEALKRAIDDEIIAKQLTSGSSAKISALQDKLSIAKEKLNNLIVSYGPRNLSNPEKKKLEAAKKLVTTALTKYETAQIAQQKSLAASAADKVKNNISKNDPVKVCSMISGMLSSMRTKINGMNFFQRSHGGKRKHTKKNNKIKKNKTRGKKVLKSSKKTQSKHRKKMTRIVRKFKN
jgi:hypothetical protein